MVLCRDLLVSFSIYNFLDEDSVTIIVISEKFIGGVWGGGFIQENAGLMSNIITRKKKSVLRFACFQLSYQIYLLVERNHHTLGLIA